MLDTCSNFFIAFLQAHMPNECINASSNCSERIRPTPEACINARHDKAQPGHMPDWACYLPMSVFDYPSTAARPRRKASMFASIVLGGTRRLIADSHASSSKGKVDSTRELPSELSSGNKGQCFYGDSCSWEATGRRSAARRRLRTWPSSTRRTRRGT